MCYLSLPPSLLLLVCSIFPYTAASVTVYGLPGAVTSTVSGVTPVYTGMQAYNPTTLNAPDLPNPAPSTAFTIALRQTTPAGVSTKIPSAFMGFSIEFSVLNQVCKSFFALQCRLPTLFFFYLFSF